MNLGILVIRGLGIVPEQVYVFVFSESSGDYLSNNSI